MFRSRHSIEHTNRMKHTRTFIITHQNIDFHTCAIRDVTLHKINTDKTHLFAVQHVSALCVHSQGAHIVDR